MGSANIPTKLMEHLIQVNKTAQAIGESQIIFTNKKRKFKAMKEIAESFGYTIENVFLSQEIEKKTKKAGNILIKLYQGDIVPIADNGEENDE